MEFRGPPEDRSIDARRTFGVINLDKPPGPTSHQVVSWVKDLLGIDRAGHAGTLDPKVTGCLPILLGNATRLAQAFASSEKEYVAVLELHGDPPANLDAKLATFEGVIYQKPPRKSAVTRRLRQREIFELTVLEQIDRHCLLRIRCEPGTYIRKLCHDLGLVLGVGAHMGDLRRTGTVPFDDSDLVTLHELADAIAFAEAGDSASLDAILQPAERAVTHLPSMTVAPTVAETVAHGSPIFAPGVIDGPDVDGGDRPLVACYTPTGRLVCLGRLVGDPDADEGEVVSLERVVVDSIEPSNQSP